MECEGAALALQGIERAVKEQAGLAPGLEVDIEVGSLLDEGQALLCIILIGDTLLHVLATHAATALADVLLADSNDGGVVSWQRDTFPTGTNDESFHGVVVD